MSQTTTFTLVPSSVQPDIGYHPEREKYEARSSLRLIADPELPKTALPDGWPKRVEGPIVWQGKDWTNEEQWVYNLSQEELREIDEAVKHFKALDIPKGYIHPSTFPLPRLGPKLRELSQVLYNGRGFFVLRTLPISTYTREDLAIAYAGIVSHVGAQRGRQSGEGAIFAHIKDLRATHDVGKIGNAAYTTDGQVFHTDAGDLIALVCLEVAKEGGTSRVASSSTIYNELAAMRPDLVKVLSEPWPVDSFGGDPAYTERPLLFYEDGHIILQYSRRHFTGFLAQKRNPTIPPISEAQAEALDAIHYLAEKHSLALNFQKGDVQIINSLGLVHARDKFVDDAEHTRHLIRIWLRDEELAWKTPKALSRIWDRLYSIKPEEQKFTLEPEIRMKAPGVGR